jgi:16S rRNA (adenine1518-N6/adenine1519-N6)-dimethyltransferase
MDIKETKAVLKRYRILPSKARGQNFLVDDAIAKRIVDEAHIKSSDVVLEIGPGLGALTTQLLKKNCKVIAIEKDRRLIKFLSDRFSTENLEIINADVLKVQLPDFDVVVSNVPYVISSPLTFKLLRIGFSRGVLTFQEEFARRLVSEPGDWDYSRLSVSFYYFADAQILETLPPRTFYPRPRVKSTVVRLTPRSPPFKFTVKRKTVRNAIKIAKKVEGIEIDLTHVPGKILEKRVFELFPEEIALLSRKRV